MMNVWREDYIHTARMRIIVIMNTILRIVFKENITKIDKETNRTITESRPQEEAFTKKCVCVCFLKIK